LLGKVARRHSGASRVVDEAQLSIWPRRLSNVDARVYEGLRSLLSLAPAGHRFQKGKSHKIEVGNNFVTAPRQ
jgi:hypothetical protein